MAAMAATGGGAGLTPEVLGGNTPLRQATRTIPVMLGSGYSSQQLYLRQMLANQNRHICASIFPNFEDLNRFG
jgi:hypothetical protein